MRAFYQRIGINEDDVKSVRYRGNGCPGPTRIETKDGQVFEETYLDFWGTEASMWHLPWRCKICADGTGEGADIAAADTWPGGSPTTEMLTNDPGSNGIIVRTQNGKDLVERAIAADYLVNEGPATIEDLNDWQPHQVNKKMAAESRYEGCRRSGHRGLRVEGMQTEALRKQLDADVDEQQVRGTMERIAIGKHRDDFGMQE